MPASLALESSDTNHTRAHPKILVACERQNTTSKSHSGVRMVEMVIHGLGGLVGMMDRLVSYCICNT